MVYCDKLHRLSPRLIRLRQSELHVEAFALRPNSETPQ